MKIFAIKFMGELFLCIFFLLHNVFKDGFAKRKKNYIQFYNFFLIMLFEKIS